MLALCNKKDMILKNVTHSFGAMPQELATFFSSIEHGLLLTDDQGTPLYWNHIFSLFLLLPKSQTLSLCKELIQSQMEKSLENADHFEILLQQVYSNRANSVIRAKCKSGETLEFEISWHEMPNYGVVCLWSVRDISKQAMELRYLQKLKDRYETAIDGSKNGIWDFDMQEDCLYISGRWRKLFSYDKETIKPVEDNWEPLLTGIHEQDRFAFQKYLARHLSSQALFFQIEFRLSNENVQNLWVRLHGVTLRDQQGIAYRMAGTLSEMNPGSSLTYRYLYDQLTGLPGRTIFKEKLSATLLEDKSKNGSFNGFCVFLIGLNRIRIINESLGYAYGDEVIKEVASRLSSRVRKEDFLSRLEGNRFAIVLRNVEDEAESMKIATSMQEAIEVPLEIGGNSLILKSHIGVVLPSTKVRKIRADELIRIGERAMDQARSKERPCHLVSLSSYLIDEEKKDKRNAVWYDNMIQKSLANGDFTLHFQPIISLRTKKVTHCEALLRSTNDKIHHIPEIIASAEQSGLISEIGSFVLEEACLFSKSLKANGFGDCQVKINVSPYELRRDDFYSRFEEIIKKEKIDPQCIGIELTESLSIDLTEEMRLTFNKLKEMGLDISIDDFGTRYSNLSSLKNLPVDTIKLDRSFVQEVVHSERSGAIAATVIALGHSFRLGVVAEGVETKEQLDFLNKFECDFIQGFIFSPALPAEEFIGYMNEKSYMDTLGNLGNVSLYN